MKIKHYKVHLVVICGTYSTRVSLRCPSADEVIDDAAGCTGAEVVPTLFLGLYLNGDFL